MKSTSKHRRHEPTRLKFTEKVFGGFGGRARAENVKPGCNVVLLLKFAVQSARMSAVAIHGSHLSFQEQIVEKSTSHRLKLYVDHPLGSIMGAR